MELARAKSAMRFDTAVLAPLRNSGISVGALIVTALLLGLVAVWMPISGLSLTFAKSSWILSLAVVFTIISGVYTWGRPNPLFAGMTGAMVIVLVSGIAAGLFGYLCASLRQPLIDAQLAHFDAALGIDYVAIIAWAADRRWLIVALTNAYDISSLIITILIITLCLLGRFDRLRELLLLWTLTEVGTTAVSAVWPALGAYAFHTIPADVLAKMPSAAGVYYMEAFKALRAGTLTVVDPVELMGVVQFPSFHTCIALIAAYALRGMGIVSGVMNALAAFTLYSAVVIGGHYVADIIGGMALFAACVVGTTWARRAFEGVASYPPIRQSEPASA
jgi:membrane-associated phospholipid phosphatase